MSCNWSCCWKSLLPRGIHRCRLSLENAHDDVVKWKHFPRYMPFLWGIHRWPVISPPKGQWRGALMFSLICARTNGWVNNRDAGDLRCHRAHYDVTVMRWLSIVRWPRRDVITYFQIFSNGLVLEPWYRAIWGQTVFVFVKNQWHLASMDFVKKLLLMNADGLVILANLVRY